MPPSSFLSDRLSGRSIFLRRDTFLARNLTCRHPTRSTQLTFFFCPMTSFLVEERFTNMHWLLSMPPSVTKKQNLWPQKTLPRLLRLSGRFTLAVLWLYLWCCRLTLAASSWEAWPRKWKVTKHIFAAVALKFTEIKPLSSVSPARLLSSCLAISMLLKCFCLRASDLPLGSKGFPKLLVHWTMKLIVSLVKSLLLQSRKRQSLQNRQQSIPDLLN